MVENKFKIDEKSKEEIKENIKRSIKSFIEDKDISLSGEQKQDIIKKFDDIKKNIPCMHSAEDLLIPTHFILNSKLNGCIVETGCCKGGSTAKLSIIAKLSNRKLYCLDSFEGLPNADEEGVIDTTAGYSVNLIKGDCLGSLQEVRNNIKNYGEIEVCELIKGWYKDTLPNFNEEILAVFCDVDFEQSTRECIKYLYPKIVSGGYFFTQDVHFPRVRRLLNDKNFWKNEVGVNEVPKLNIVTKRVGYYIK